MTEQQKNTYRTIRGLWMLPRLVRRQRRQAAKAAQWVLWKDREKATRGAIDALLAKVGLTKHGDAVTCLGYDVAHRHKAGRMIVDPELLRARGVSEDDIAAATVEEGAADFATVWPMKGAEVRA